MVNLRERNRRNTLALTQRTAVAMFVERGFDEVKVTDIAEAVGMAPSTLYRHYPTKEAIVLWDEHELEYGEMVGQALREHPPFTALREAFVAAAAGRYDADTEFQLQRVTLLYQTPAIHAAAAEADWQDRYHLTELLRPEMSTANRDAADLLAGAALLAVDWAFDRWQATEAATPVAELTARAFDRLDHLAAVA